MDLNLGILRAGWLEGARVLVISFHVGFIAVFLKSYARRFFVFCLCDFYLGL